MYEVHIEEAIYLLMVADIVVEDCKGITKSLKDLYG